MDCANVSLLQLFYTSNINGTLECFIFLYRGLCDIWFVQFYLCVFFVSNTVLVLRGGLVDRKKNCVGGGGGRRWGGSPRAPYRLAPPLPRIILIQIPQNQDYRIQICCHWICLSLWSKLCSISLRQTFPQTCWIMCNSVCILELFICIFKYMGQRQSHF